MKYTAFWLTLGACCAFSVGTAMAQGAGQGHHEVGSGVGNPSVQGGAGGVSQGGQGKEGPSGTSGADVRSTQNNNSAGQGKFEAGGSGGGNNQVGAPVNNGAPANNRAAINPGAPMARPAPAPDAKHPAPNANQAQNRMMQKHQGETDRNARDVNNWRFVFGNGMWWYYQTDNSWTYYQNGAWQNYNDNSMRIARRPERMDRQHEAIQGNEKNNKTNNNANNKSGANDKNGEKH